MISNCKADRHIINVDQPRRGDAMLLSRKLCIEVGLGMV